MRVFDVKSFVDIGCGPGGMVTLAAHAGLDALGIDGDWSLRPSWEADGIDVTLHDYTRAPLAIAPRDLCWMVEFVEHVAEKYLEHVFSTVESCCVVCMTHALPGAQGHHHVNCRPEAYWIDQFTRRGFVLDAKTTDQVRKQSSMKRDFMRLTGKVFLRQ